MEMENLFAGLADAVKQQAKGECSTHDDEHYVAKLKKHRDNPDRLKDYLGHYFTEHDPLKAKESPIYAEIKEAVSIMEKAGWTVGITDWKTLGKQVAFADNTKDLWYHSSYAR